jgi:hypothetical protein
MAIQVKHGFTSGKTDGADATQVQPSHWNADHTLQITGPALIGREAGTLGDAAEITLGAGLTLSAGVLSASGGATNLTSSTTSTTVTVLSDTGTDAILGAATGSVAGVMVAADKTKLDGIATAATANAADADLRDRTTHTGVQAIATVTGLQTALDGKLAATTGIAVATSRAITSTDLENVLDVSAASTLTIPTDATLGISTTSRVVVSAYQQTTGAVTWAPDAGVATLKGSVPTAAQYLVTSLMHVGANEWAYL